MARLSFKSCNPNSQATQFETKCFRLPFITENPSDISHPMQKDKPNRLRPLETTPSRKQIQIRFQCKTSLSRIHSIVFFRNESQDNTTASKSSTLGFVSAVLVIGGLVGLSIVYKEDLQNLLQAFTAQVKGMGVRGYFAYAGILFVSKTHFCMCEGAYVVLETIALPATPLTLAAGYLFGVLPGVCVVSISSTIAATLAFLISRYLLREKVLSLSQTSRNLFLGDRILFGEQTVLSHRSSNRKGWLSNCISIEIESSSSFRCEQLLVWINFGACSTIRCRELDRNVAGNVGLH